MTNGDLKAAPVRGGFPFVRLFGRALLAMLPLCTPLFRPLAQYAHAQRFFQDPPKVVEARDTLTEQQDDHVEALTLFAHGRALLQRSRLQEGGKQQQLRSESLRRFQRAWRFDPELVSIFTDIVPLILQLERPFQATRYLIMAAEQEQVPVKWTARIAVELAQNDRLNQAQAERAWALFQQVKEQQGEKLSIAIRLQIGRLALVTGQFETAAEAFSAVQEAVEETGDARIPAAVRDQLLKRPNAIYTLFGESYLKAHQFEKAETAFRRANEHKLAPSQLAFQLARIETEQGNETDALDLLQQYFDSKTKTAGLAPYVLLARLMDGSETRQDEQPAPSGAAPTAPPRSAAEKPSDALIAKLQELAKADPNNALLGYYLADTLRRAERWKSAERLYKRWLQEEPTLDGHLGLINIYRRQTRWTPLLKQLAGVITETGSLVPVATETENIVSDPMLLDQITEKGEAYGAAAGSTPPEGTWLTLALLSAAGDRGEAALAYLERGLEEPIAKAGEAACEVALALLQADRPRQAAGVFRRVLDDKLLPDRTAEIYYYLAGAWAAADQFNKSLSAANHAARRAPNSPRMVAREAWVLFQADRLNEARAKYLEILDQFDSDYSTRENRREMRDLRLLLSAVEVELGNQEAAEQWLLQVLEEFPEDIGAYNDLGYLWADRGEHLHRALRMVEKAVEAAPQNIAYLDSLGWALYRLGRCEEALKPLEKAAAAPEPDGMILDHLGDVYLKTQRPRKAIKAWRDAISAFKEQGNRQRVKAIKAKVKRHAHGQNAHELYRSPSPPSGPRAAQDRWEPAVAPESGDVQLGFVTGRKESQRVAEP